MERAFVNAEDLAILVRVVDSGGVTRAAEALHVAQPAVTQRLRRLERVVGTPLVERKGRILGLTDAGRTVLPLARQVLQLLDRIGGVEHGIDAERQHPGDRSQQEAIPSSIRFTGASPPPLQR